MWNFLHSWNKKLPSGLLTASGGENGTRRRDWSLKSSSVKERHHHCSTALNLHLYLKSFHVKWELDSCVHLGGSTVYLSVWLKRNNLHVFFFSPLWEFGGGDVQTSSTKFIGFLSLLFSVYSESTVVFNRLREK